ncbi:MAG: DUF11 domain-containing protein [Proteobacteria bacterium]|nr:DUF11 domain-containing protein [Pseudomonadota bacterium]
MPVHLTHGGEFLWQPSPVRPGRSLVAVFAASVLLLGMPTWQGRALAQGVVDNPKVAEATGSGPLATSIEVQKLEISVGPGGEEIRRWAPAERLNAGDEIHYTVRVHNPGKQAVDTVVVTKRLPFGVRYLRGSATGPAAEVQFSIDGGETYATPEMLARAAGGGKKGLRKPLENDYTHVRWVLRKPLGPASTALLRFRATFY